MSNLIYEGVVLERTKPSDFTDKSGRVHTECTILVETTDEEYPQQMAIRLMDLVCANAPDVGKRVRCTLKCRVNSRTSGRWFNDIKAWRVELC